MATQVDVRISETAASEVLAILDALEGNQAVSARVRRNAREWAAYLRAHLDSVR